MHRNEQHLVARAHQALADQLGAAVGAVVITLDEYLKKTGKSWRAPVLAVAVGIYLPLELSTPIFAGGLVRWLTTRNADAKQKRDRCRCC